MSKRPIQISIVVILLIVIVAFGDLFYQQRTHGNLINLPKAVTIDTKNQPTLGNPKATVHIVVFEDLKCIVCKFYSTTLFPTIKKQFIDSGKAKYTLINLAFIPGSMTAATTARCLYAQKTDYFFQFVDYVYHHQGSEAKNWATIPLMLEYAHTIKGIDSKKLEACILNNPYQEFLDSNLKLAEKIMGPTVATPSVYINGVKVVPLTLAQFTAVYNKVK